MSIWPRRLLWLIYTLPGMYLVWFSAMYFSFDEHRHFLNAKPDWLVQDPVWRAAFYIHISGGILCMLTGPWQFIPALRNHFPKFHRISGYLYMTGILVLGGPAGLYMAFWANGGIIGAIGFAIMAILWMGISARALDLVLQKRLAEHRAWMLRSIALTFAAVTLRIWVPLASLVFGLDADLTETLSAWVSWLPNLLVAELLIRFSAVSSKSIFTLKP